MNKPNLTLFKIINHWKTIHTHRKWARNYCFLAGIPWRGLFHDLSKYSPIEFFESAITQAKFLSFNLKIFIKPRTLKYFLSSN